MGFVKARSEVAFRFLPLLLPLFPSPAPAFPLDPLPPAAAALPSPEEADGIGSGVDLALASAAESASTGFSSDFFVWSSGRASSVGSGGGFSFRLMIEVENSWDIGRMVDVGRNTSGL